MNRAQYDQWKASDVARLLALVETERRYYQDIFATMPLAVAIVSRSQEVLAANREFRRAFGLKASEVAGCWLAELFPGIEFEAALQDLGGTDAPVQLDDGKQSRVLSVQRIRGWQEDEYEYLLTVAPKPAEPEPPASDENAGRRLAEELEAVAWEMDPVTLSFRWISSRCQELLAMPAESWQRLEHWAETRVHPADRDRYLEFYQTGLTEVGRGSIEYRIFDSGALVRWLRDYARLTAEGVVVGLTLDITDDKREDRKLAGRMKREALERLSGRLAHVSNNLLMIVGGYAEELKSSLPLDDARRSDVDEILKASNRLASLTMQLNAFTRPQSYERQEFDLGSWMQTLPMRLASAATAGVRIEPQPPQAAYKVASNAHLLEQILLETLKALAPQLPNGTVLPLVVYGEGAESVRLILQVPTGLLDEDTRELFLEPFSGPKEGADPPLGAAGFVKPLEAIGGSVIFDGEPGEPFGLHLTLPASVEKIEAAPPRPAATVLLVEDEPGIRSLVHKALTRQGYAVVEAGNPQEALDLCQSREEPVDLVVTDLTVPGMTGRMLAEEVRRKWPETRVVFISGYTGDAELAAMIDAGTLPAGTAFLSKPFSVGALVDQVKALLAD